MSGPLRDRLPALYTERLAVLGPRDVEWRRQFNVGSLRDLGVNLRPHDEVAAAPAAAARGGLRRHAHRPASDRRVWAGTDRSSEIVHSRPTR